MINLSTLKPGDKITEAEMQELIAMLGNQVIIVDNSKSN